MSAQSKYEVIKGKFVCQKCQQEVGSARFYPTLLDITWMCRSCNEVSQVNIFKEKGY